jgi:hypothetical protein
MWAKKDKNEPVWWYVPITLIPATQEEEAG